MKHTKRVLAIVLAGVLLLSAVSAAAESSKVEQVLAALEASSILSGVNGTATYEDGGIELAYSTQIAEFSEVTFSYDGTVIEYDPGEITTYEEASDATSHVMYAMRILYAALELNGYDEDQIAAYFRAEDSHPTMETTGFELTQQGEAKTFESDDGSSVMTMTPMAVKIDVAAARLYAPGSDMAEPTDTTVEDVAEYLNADETFRSCMTDNSEPVYENEAAAEDGWFTISHTDYNTTYYNTWFDCEDGVLTYEVAEIADYAEANEVAQHGMWALVLVQFALEVNGYSQEEITAFMSAEGNGFDFDRNGIEFRELGEAQTFEGDDGDVTVTPVSIKIDFNRANLDPAADVSDESDVSEATSTEPVSPATGDGDTGAIALALCLTALAAAVLTLTRRVEE